MTQDDPLYQYIDLLARPARRYPKGGYTMQTAYSPMAFIDALARERRANPRAQRDPRPTARQRLGLMLIRTGLRFRGERPDRLGAAAHGRATAVST